MLHEVVTEKIIGAFYKVYNCLGYGFLEKVYQNAMMIELAEQGFTPAKQEEIKVFYKGAIVGDYFADIIINDKVILELKAAESLRDEHVAQLTNYLKATDAPELRQKALVQANHLLQRQEAVAQPRLRKSFISVYPPHPHHTRSSGYSPLVLSAALRDSRVFLQKVSSA